MQEHSPDPFNWPERPSSSDSAPDVKLEQASDPKAFYVPPSSTVTATLTNKSVPTSTATPSIRRHSSTAAQLRRSKHPYSPTPHEARIRNKYGGEATKMSSHNYSQQWIKSENGGRQNHSFPNADLTFHRRNRKAAGVRVRHVWGYSGTTSPLPWPTRMEVIKTPL
jgi:hypothetical protein